MRPIFTAGSARSLRHSNRASVEHRELISSSHPCPRQMIQGAARLPVISATRVATKDAHPHASVFGMPVAFHGPSSSDLRLRGHELRSLVETQREGDSSQRRAASTLLGSAQGSSSRIDAWVWWLATTCARFATQALRVSRAARVYRIEPGRLRTQGKRWRTRV